MFFKELSSKGFDFLLWKLSKISQLNRILYMITRRVFITLIQNLLLQVNLGFFSAFTQHPPF